MGIKGIIWDKVGNYDEMPESRQGLFIPSKGEDCSRSIYVLILPQLKG